MKARGLITFGLLLLVIVSVGVVVLRESGKLNNGSLAELGTFLTGGNSRIVIVYYFHATVRCHTCLTIEDYAYEALRTHFSDELKSGTIVWRPLNYEEPPNKHFVEEYQLYSQALIVVDSTIGKGSRTKNLEAIWEKVGDKDAFLSYVHGEVAAYLKEM